MGSGRERSPISVFFTLEHTNMKIILQEYKIEARNAYEKSRLLWLEHTHIEYRT